MSTMKKVEKLICDFVYDFVEEKWDKINKKKIEITQTKEEFLKEVKTDIQTAVWVVTEGPYYQDLPYMIAFACRLKKTAMSICKRDGYKYNKEQYLYLNETERRGRKLDKVEWEE